MSFQKESVYYKSIIYKGSTLRFDYEERTFSIAISDCCTNVKILVNDFGYYKEKANLQENDSLQGQLFKIANYICSRLCDKIEK